MLQKNETFNLNEYLQKHLELSPFYQSFCNQFRQIGNAVRSDKAKAVLTTYPQILEIVHHFMLMMEASRKTDWNVSKTNDRTKWFLPCKKPEDKELQFHNIYTVMNTRNPNSPVHHLVSSTAMWEHNCGFLFTIGDCGNPNFVR